MTVYVDESKHEVFHGRRRYVMCHMLADSLGELHSMADTIGVSRRYFQHAKRWNQHPHYDICKAKRQLAIINGAVEVTCREMVRVRQRIRQNADMPKVRGASLQTA